MTRSVRDGEVAENLDAVVLKALEEGWDSDDQLLGAIAEAVHYCWLQLFDFLALQPERIGEEAAAACYLQMMRSLELNEEVDDGVDWGRLLARIQRRIDLISAPKEKPPILHPGSPDSATVKSSNTSQQRVISRVGTTKSNFSRRARRPKQLTDENQRALDRLSYLGGILIPLPIISGILSMGDVYGPDGAKFFVFWAVAAPLAVLTVVLIYADTIRKSEVWVEIGVERVVPDPEGKSISSIDNRDGPVDIEVKHRRTVTWRRHHPGADDEQPQPRQQDDVVFALDHDAEERVIGMPAGATPAAAVQSDDEDVWDWLPPAARWNLGWGEVPAVILERPSDGSAPKAWKRGQLGWTGALQTILRRKFRDGNDVPEGIAASEKPRKRKAVSY